MFTPTKTVQKSIQFLKEKKEEKRLKNPTYEHVSDVYGLLPRDLTPMFKDN